MVNAFIYLKNVHCELCIACFASSVFELRLVCFYYDALFVVLCLLCVFCALYVVENGARWFVYNIIALFNIVSTPDTCNFTGQRMLLQVILTYLIVPSNIGCSASEHLPKPSPTHLLRKCLKRQKFYI